MERGDYGFVEWFRPGDYERVDQAIADLRRAGASWLRTHLSWAEYYAEGGEAWYDWLLPRLGAEFDLLPCVHYTPPSIARNGRSTGAPRVLKDYADFLDLVLTRHGRHFEYVELWNEPNNLLDWDWRADPDYALFCEMVGGAAYWVNQRGWKPVLGGPCPFDPAWVELMGERGLLAQMHAVGLHGFPGTWDSEEGSWKGWKETFGELRGIVDRYNPAAEIWITEAGYSTWRNDQGEQVRRFLDAKDAGADRLYWYAWRDLPETVSVQEGFWFDPRHYHLGVRDTGNRPKLLATLLEEGGVARLREVSRLAAPPLARAERPVLITGGSGFIGSNLADDFLNEGREVVLFDNLSRPGVVENLEWLIDRHGARLHPLAADLRDPQALREAVRDASAVIHLAAQTAVTTSLDNPVEDFDVNARGTLNLLEAVRGTGRALPVVFASTNKVYGALGDLEMREADERYQPADPQVAEHGVSEARPLDFCTPYGCSKGVADQYVLDYAKSYGLPAAVLRMSCIYGPRQFGTEDQGWVAHFLISALKREPIQVFGDGKQVRDILHVADAVRAYRFVLENIGALSGQAFNLGGGARNAVSLRMVLDEIARIDNRPPQVSFHDWRKGDQHYFVADTRRLERATGWHARIGWQDGLADLARWLRANRDLPAADAATPARAIA